MTAAGAPPPDDDPNRRIYRSYVSSGARVAIPQDGSEVGPRAPYLKRLVRNLFPADRQARVLDLGCGDGALLFVAQQAGYRQITGVDLSPEQVEIARSRGLPRIEEAEIMPFLAAQPAQSYDLVIAFDVIEHLSKPELMAVMGEIHRVLRDGGRWIIHVPNAQSPFFGRIRYGDFTHEMAFTQRSLASVLRVTGFAAIECFEDQPTAHGLVSLIRLMLWKILINGLRLYIMIESGERGDDLIFSQNLLAIASKPAARE